MKKFCKIKQLKTVNKCTFLRHKKLHNIPTFKIAIVQVFFYFSTKKDLPIKHTENVLFRKTKRNVNGFFKELMIYQ